MKKWMALLLGCLLCLCAAGAMAEGAVTIVLRSDNRDVYDIYPNGYTKPSGETVQFYPHEGPYIITGDKTNYDTPLDFHANEYDENTGKVKTENGQHVSYDVTFKNLEMYYRDGCTIIRFGCNEEPAQDCSITLNLSLSGTSYLTSYAYSVFRYAFGDESSAVKICVQPSDGRMQLNCGAPVDGNSVLYAEGKTITSENAASYSGMEVSANLSSPTDLIEVAGSPATCTEDGMKEYWKCPTCGTLYADAAGLKATTLTDLKISALNHDLSLVPAKPATCTEDGYEAHYACANCPELFADENATMSLPQPKAIPATGHDFGEDWESDAAKHWHACACGERSGEAEHSFVTVVDRKPGETEPGEQHEECTVCGYRKAAVSIPAVGRIDLPQTGDSSHLLGWAALLGACCAGLAALKKRRG